jgi:hypothetical protein
LWLSQVVSAQILINKTPVRDINPDVRQRFLPPVFEHSQLRNVFAIPQIVLLGDADEIVLRLCFELGWGLPPSIAAANRSSQLQVARNPMKRPSMDPIDDKTPKRVGKR